MLVSLIIVVILLSLSALAFRRITESNVLAQAKNAVLNYAKIARSYAIANRIETMMVVNPFNGRFEMWHLNPPADGGSFDELSAGTAPPFTDGYAFAPVLDSGARLPLDGSGRPLAAVHPIDYGDDSLRPFISDTDQNMDNMTWAAMCFDASGELVIRTRRIATRTYTLRDGSLRPQAERNRLLDESPDLSTLAVGPMVHGDPAGDTPITSTRGFVISDAAKMRAILGDTVSTGELVNNWLLQTRPGGLFHDFADTVVLNRFSGSELLESF